MITITNQHFRKKIRVIANRNHEQDTWDLTISKKVEVLNDMNEWENLKEAKSVRVVQITNSNLINPATGLLTEDPAGVPAYDWILDRTGAEMNIGANAKVWNKVDAWFETFAQNNNLIGG